MDHLIAETTGTEPEIPATWMRERFAVYPQLADWQARGLRFHRYQIESVLKVLDDLEGSAILADEVGLGKTIEAGLILMELKSRGQLQNALILVPAGLVTQWIEELGDKFGIAAMRDPKDRGWLWVLSLDTAKRSPLKEQLQCVLWDLVIVDEAHHLKNPNTQNYQLVAGMRRNRLLLLTATPMENQLTELYNLVNLVKPGVFGSYLRFYRQFILDKRTPKNARELRELLSRVMVRNQRKDVGLNLPPREVLLWPIALAADERRLYDELSDALRREYRERLEGDRTLLPLILMQRELCSSPQALIPTLRGQDWLGDRLGELIRLAESIAMPSKMRQVVELVRGLKGRLLVFTEFRATQEALIFHFNQAGLEARAFHGGLRPRERDHLIAWFAAGDGVLVSTEAGGQGLNLQCCHRLINFDLPWNPMRIEQRIGRIHRIGQQNPVEIYNLFSVDTVEEHILHLLHEKIDLFRRVIGDLDVILRHLERRGSLERRLLGIFFGERDQAELLARLDALGNEFVAARRRLAWPPG